VLKLIDKSIWAFDPRGFIDREKKVLEHHGNWRRYSRTVGSQFGGEREFTLHETGEGEKC